MTKKQEDRTIKLDNEEIAKATFPIVISVSRSTDIPAFYADWFLGRLKKGYSATHPTPAAYILTHAVEAFVYTTL
mgnify:CR=1 FL=1